MAASSKSRRQSQKVQDEPDINSRTRVESLDILHKGDHVAWRQLAGLYWHHCIVSDVNPRCGKLEVIGYDTYAVLLEEAEILRHWVTFDLKKKNLYRIEYNPGICYPPEVVLVRAMGQLGNKGYNLFTRNCEHFARWCKTGDNVSTQVEAFQHLLNLKHSHANLNSDRGYCPITVYHVSASTSQPLPRSGAFAQSSGIQSPQLPLIQTYHTKFDTSAK